MYNKLKTIVYFYEYHIVINIKNDIGTMLYNMFCLYTIDYIILTTIVIVIYQRFYTLNIK